VLLIISDYEMGIFSISIRVSGEYNSSKGKYRFKKLTTDPLLYALHDVVAVCQALRDLLGVK
jgi:hypothetical protein